MSNLLHRLNILLFTFLWISAFMFFIIPRLTSITTNTKLLFIIRFICLIAMLASCIWGFNYVFIEWGIEDQVLISGLAALSVVFFTNIFLNGKVRLIFTVVPVVLFAMVLYFLLK